MQLTPEIKKLVLDIQRLEITDYHIYKRLAAKVKSAENAKILERIAADELGHYEGWKKTSGEDVARLCGKTPSSSIMS